MVRINSLVKQKQTSQQFYHIFFSSKSNFMLVYIPFDRQLSWDIGKFWKHGSNAIY